MTDMAQPNAARRRAGAKAMAAGRFLRSLGAACVTACFMIAAAGPGSAREPAGPLATGEVRGETQPGAQAGTGAAARPYRLQYSMAYLSAYKLLDPFINLTKAGDGYWRIERGDAPPLSYGEALEQGYIDPQTGMPRRLPANARAITNAPVLHGMSDYPRYYAGGYTMEWEGDAFGFLLGQPRDMQRRRGAGKLSFYVRPETRRGVGIGFSRLREDGLTSFRVYRDDHRKRLEAGEIWNPDFIAHMRRYDVIRTMGFQRINASPVTKFSQVARPEDAFYGNALKSEWPAPPRYGVPYEALFDLAISADADLWLHVPPMIGAPMHPGHPSLRNENGGADWEKIAAMAQENARAIVESPEWGVFAAALADRLVASGYDARRPLYIEIGNEIWNWGPPFGLNTGYFNGLGRGLRARWGDRQAYGLVLARFAHLFETELQNRGLEYNTVYVLASHTANPYATTVGIDGFEAGLKDIGEEAARRLTARTGVALTTYTRCSGGFGETRFGKLGTDALARAWEDAIREDSEALKRDLHDFCLNATQNNERNLQHVLSSWKRHHEIVEKRGLRLMGAYEGGSHDWPRDLIKASATFRAWWRDFHWGPYGADIVRRTNLALIEAFPGVMLSDFDSVGAPGNAPWVEGHYAEETDLMRVWDEFARPRPAGDVP